MTVAIYEQPSTLIPTRHQTQRRALRPQTPPAAHDALQERTGVFSHLRNAVGLMLVGGGVIGMMSLICGSFVR
jgi:hypothetical protein